MNLITIKDYASRSGISYEAARQVVNRHREELGCHLVKKKRTQYLDDEAVKMLNDIRGDNELSARLSSDAEEIADLRREKEVMLEKIALQASEIAAMATWKAEKALLIAEAEQNRRALDDAKVERDELRDQLASETQRADDNAKIASATQDKLDTAEDTIQKLRSRNLWERIVNK